MKLDDLPDTPYWRATQGFFSGVLRWPEMADLWARLKADPDRWFVFDTQGPPPRAPLPAGEFLAFLDDVETFVRARHRHDYCGFVYVDDRCRPKVVKIFDPAEMGSSCGCSGELVLPRWLVSRLPPDPLPEPPERRKTRLWRWFARARAS